ncbi:winged helix-turn-helix domain-containing protein [Ekhidna sp.]
MISQFIRFFFFISTLLLLVLRIEAQDTFAEKHLEVSLRMIGHKVLLSAGDSTSRVLPIIKNGNQYRIEFESEFGFQPEELVRTIDEIMKQAKTSIRYIVEVESCFSGMVVYSFEINNLDHQDIISCTSRNQVKECYSLLFTILDKPILASKKLLGEAEKSNLNTNLTIPISIGLIALFGVGFVVFRNRKTSKEDGTIRIGKYRFDQRNALLILEEQKIELTGKEADLLQLLLSSVNSAVKREDMLNKVWGDEGNYIGRTLDVFISKLRGKLQADPSIKIMNIRGIGYKLIINE